MRISRLHVESTLATGTRIRLSDVASRHVTKTLRLAVDDPITVFDGSGGEYDATIARVARGAVEVDVGAHRPADRESMLQVELGQAICRGERMDLVVQKATELRGTGDPSSAQRAHGRPAEPGAGPAPDRALAGGRGARGAAVGPHPGPGVARVEALDRWLARPEGGPSFLLSAHAATSISDLEPPEPGVTVRLLVGPEGGLAPGEVARARDAGFAELRLGPRVLRTETAALVALGVLQARWGDLR